MPALAINVLHYGVNLNIVRRYPPNAPVDLLDLDPPFDHQP